MIFLTKLKSERFGFAVKAATLAITLTVLAMPQVASADTIIVHGQQFNKEWFEDNKDNYDYSPLNGAEAHYDNVVGLERVVYAFKVKKSYCKPPHQPQKAKDRRLLDEFAKILRKRQKEQAALAPLAAMVRESEHAAEHRINANYLLVDSIHQYFSEIVDMISAKRKALEAAPELDCSKTNQQSAMRMRNNNLLGALNGARQTNPHNINQREVALPGQNGSGLDTLSRANQGSSNARVTTGQPTTSTSGQPSNQNSSTNRSAGQPTNPPVIRESADATGLFPPTLRTENPISRETGDSTGIFNNTRVGTPTTRVDRPIMRETGDSTGVFSEGGKTEPLQPTSRALSFPGDKYGAFSNTRVGSSVERAGSAETMTEPNY